MASRREGIALLSMYNDEEEEEEEEEEEWELEKEKEHAEKKEIDGCTPQAQGEEYEKSAKEEEPEEEEEEEEVKIEDSDGSPLPILRSSTPTQPKTLNGSPMDFDPSPSPIPPLLASRPSTPLVSAGPFPPTATVVHRRNPVAIVDYAHDETALSSEPEEGEMVADLDMLDAQLEETDEGSYEDRSSPGGAQASPFPAQATPQSHQQPEAPQFETGGVAADAAVEEADVSFPGDVKMEAREELDPLSTFLPPPPATRCSSKLQEKINKFLALKRVGKSFNSDLRNMKDYRNPDFLQHAVRYQEINQMGTCFSKDVFDPDGYDRADYYDNIEADMKRELERKELERKRSPKVEFIPGGIQNAVVAPVSKINAQIPGSSAIISNVQTAASAPLDLSSKENRQNKKSKWDKVDIDSNISLQSGGMSAAAHSSTLASSANSGGGYSAFVQQKRREAEEKQSSERKYDKRT